MRYPWPGRVISNKEDALWKLGRDGVPVKLPQPFGTFRVGEIRGGVSSWRLKNSRIDGSVHVRIEAGVTPYQPPKLGQPGRRLDGSWALGRRALHLNGDVVVRKLA